MRRALIVRGGWEGHEPKLVSEIFLRILKEEGFAVEMQESLDAFLDQEHLKALDLIVPIWTMGEISKAQCDSVINAVASGVGLAGNHGGMCDAFRQSVQWQFMTGGNWVAHPGNDGTEYMVEIINSSSPITEGVANFLVKSEQYYLHVDPAVEVLATTRFPTADGPHVTNGPVDMPVVWTKRWGRGRIFYNSLGHHADVMELPESLTMMRRGFLWAAEGKQIAQGAATSDKDVPSMW